jgi:hypothetical protein
MDVRPWGMLARSQPREKPMTRPWMISRRTMLRGVGAALALPLLETMGWAETPKSGGRPPVRLAFINVPHGVDNANFWPADGKPAANAPLPKILEPLRPVIADCLILGGLNHLRAYGDGNAPHPRETATWLTGFPAKPNTVENAISADQIAAQKIGVYTSLPSLELGTHVSNRAGDCQMGYTCAYNTNISWRSATQPMPKEISPRAVFGRLFSSRKASPARGGRGPSVDAAAFASAPGGASDAPTAPSLDQSMLDLVLKDARRLRDRVSGNDQRKLDEYLDGVRQLEQRVQAIERQQAEAGKGGAAARRGAKDSPLIELKIPDAIPTRFDEHARLMADLIALAFQSDTTRITTLMLGPYIGAIAGYPEIGVPEAHHELSHHGNDPAKLAKLTLINTYHVAQLAYLMQRLKGLKEGGGTLLDNCMILYGSGMADGDKHNHHSLPTILAGGGGGTIRSGRYIKSCNGNFCDLLMAMLARAGCPVESLGDGTKLLPDLV